MRDDISRLGASPAYQLTSPAPGTAAGFDQRVKALATTAPLHDMDARKAMVQTADYSVYQMAELALHAIDLVTIAMDFDTGAHPDRVHADLVTFVAAQSPTRSTTEHERVAGWVIENLLNVGSLDRGFRTVYGHSGAGGYDRRSFDFKLLEETRGSDGELYLRASNEVVNVLVGALEVDLEAAHEAADVRLGILIKRGLLGEAQSAAQNARYRTIQFGESLRQRLEATSRDVRNVDWVRVMPAFLDEALTHIEARYRAENAILVNITEVRDTADSATRKAQAAALVEVVRDCLRRHDQLQGALQSAGRKFRGEQDRQAFTSSQAAVSIDLHAQLLRPAMSLTVGAADPVLARFFTPATGLTVPAAVRLADLFDSLITPAAERDTLGAPIDEPDLSDDTEPDRFPAADYTHLDALLDLRDDTVVRLSDLLAAARDIESDDPETEDLPLLLVVRVLAMATQEIGAARRHHDPSVLLAVDDGTPLRDQDFAGSDLLVTRAVLLSTPASAAEADDATDSRPAGDGAPAQHPDDQDPQVEISA